MSPRTLLFAVVITSLGALEGCKPKASPPAPHEAHEAEHPETGKRAGAETLPLAGMRGIAFLTAPERRAEGAWFPAEAVGDVGALRDLTAPVGGILTAILVAPGRAVTRGTPLATLQSPELARLLADVLTAEARVERAEAEMAREERLLAAGAGAQRDVDAARAELRTVGAEREAARLALSARGLSPEEAGAIFTLRAPAAGSVVLWKAGVGQGITAGQELGSLQAGAAALALLELAPPGPQGWGPGAVADVRGADGRKWRATLEGVPSALGAESRRLSYRLRLSGAPLPLPGVPLEVHVPLATAVILPQAALQQIEGVWGVFVREGEAARFVPVRRGAELGSDVMVLEGVKPGDVVVSEGAYLLKSLRLRRSGAEDDHGH